MRLAPLLIIEGRKEDLRKKYKSKFSADPEHIEVLDYALGHPFLAQTNFKYGDFLLKNLHPNSSIEEIIDDIELIKEFDRFQQSLEEKDINKYSFAGLRNTIQSHKQKSKSHNKKVDTEGAKKLYEDSNILIVKPLTYEASCKYGSGTRWCTTMANTPTYFNQYTSGNDQALYYVILKKFDRSNKFYKIAIHKKPGAETWYDATDERMTEREKEVFNLGAPKVIETIRNEWNKELDNSGYSITKFGAEMEVWRASQEGVDVVVVNPGVILGSGFWNSGSGKLFSQVNNGFRFYTEGVTGFVSVQDVVKPMILLMNSPVKNERFILISENKSFKEIFFLIADTLGKSRPSIKIKPWQTNLFWRFAWCVSKIARKEPLLSKYSARSAHSVAEYSSEKIQKKINYQFEDLEKSVQRISKRYLK